MKYIFLRITLVLYFLGLPSMFAQVASKPLFMFTKIENPAVLTIKEEYSTNFVYGKYIMQTLTEDAVEKTGNVPKYKRTDGAYNLGIRYVNEKIWSGIAGQMSYVKNSKKEELFSTKTQEDYAQYNFYFAKEFPGNILHVGTNINYDTSTNTVLEEKYMKKRLNFGFGATYQVAPNVYLGVLGDAMHETPESYIQDMWSFRYGAGASYRHVIDDLFVARLEASYIRSPMRYLVGDHEKSANGRVLKQDMLASVEVLWVTHTFFSLENVIQMHYKSTTSDELAEMGVGARKGTDIGGGYSAKFVGLSVSLYGTYSLLSETLMSSTAGVKQTGSKIDMGLAYTF